MKSEQLTANKMKDKHNVLNGSIQVEEFFNNNNNNNNNDNNYFNNTNKKQSKAKKKKEKKHSFPFDFIFICFVQCNQD